MMRDFEWAKTAQVPEGVCYCPKQELTAYYGYDKKGKLIRTTGNCKRCGGYVKEVDK